MKKIEPVKSKDFRVQMRELGYEIENVLPKTIPEPTTETEASFNILFGMNQILLGTLLELKKEIEELKSCQKPKDNAPPTP